MTLAEAVAEITDICPMIEGDPGETITICSGGSMIGDMMPALYASEHLALKAFVASVKEILTEQHATEVCFVDGPHLDRYSMTVETPRRQHRIAEPRWAVQARIGI